MDAGRPGIMTPSDEKAEDSTIKWYQQAIGSLLYATMQTRPDIHEQPKFRKRCASVKDRLRISKLYILKLRYGY